MAIAILTFNGQQYEIAPDGSVYYKGQPTGFVIDVDHPVDMGATWQFKFTGPNGKTGTLYADKKNHTVNVSGLGPGIIQGTWGIPQSDNLGNPPVNGPPSSPQVEGLSTVHKPESVAEPSTAQTTVPMPPVFDLIHQIATSNSPYQRYVNQLLNEYSAEKPFWFDALAQELVKPEWDPTELRQAQTEAVNRQYRDAIQQTINSLAQKGVLDSSTAARALGNVSGKALDAYAKLEASLAKQVAQNRRDRWNAAFGILDELDRWNQMRQNLITQVPYAAQIGESALNQYSLNEASPATPQPQPLWKSWGYQSPDQVQFNAKELNAIGKDLTNYFGVNTQNWNYGQFADLGKSLLDRLSTGQTGDWGEGITWERPNNSLLGTITWNDKTFDLDRYWNEGRYW